MNQRGFFTERAIGWLVAIAAGLALSGAAVWTWNAWWDNYDEARRAEGREAGHIQGHAEGRDQGQREVKALWDAAVKEENTRQATLEAERTRQQKEAARANAQALDRARTDAARLRDAGVRQQQRIDQLIAAGRQACPAQPAAGRGPGEQGSDPLDLLAQLYSRADREAGELAGYADTLRAVGERCERSHDIEVTP